MQVLIARTEAWRNKSSDSRRAPVVKDEDTLHLFDSARQIALAAHIHNKFASLAHRWCRR